jgi:hypothetical protein
MPLLTFKLSLITFWGLWLCVVLLTNVCEELKLLRILPPYWRFASQNFQAIADATRRYQAPPWVPHILFVGVLVWQMGTVVIFGEAIVASWVTGTVAMGLVNTALASSLGLLAAFMIADEVFTQYDLERAHALFFIAQLVTLLALHTLPAE